MFIKIYFIIDEQNSPDPGIYHRTFLYEPSVRRWAPNLKLIFFAQLVGYLGLKFII